SGFYKYADIHRLYTQSLSLSASALHIPFYRLSLKAGAKINTPLFLSKFFYAFFLSIPDVSFQIADK
ncbi:MAG: hypothetical protein LBL57_08165, partial [Tannerella sp.]|nr:hypothetical protein [Tannerella sp.]